MKLKNRTNETLTKELNFYKKIINKDKIFNNILAIQKELILRKNEK